MEAITREEKIISGENLTPITRKELFLAKAAGQDVKTPTPITREEMFLSKISSGGTASGENKLAQLVDGTITELTAQDLAGITSIRESAFMNCTNLITVDIPDSVTRIYTSAFEDCSSLTSVTIPDSVTRIDGYAFRYSGLTSLNIPDSVTRLDSNLCASCKKLTSVTLSKNITNLPFATFSDCKNLTAITIPENITTIGGVALTIGISTNKATITFLSTTPPTIQTNTFNASYLNKIIVPAGSGDAYKTATNWAEWADYIEEATA